MIKYSQTVEKRMKEFARRAGVPTLVPVPGADLPRDSATESLLRRVKTLRMDSIPYGLPQLESRVLLFIPELSASLMFGQKMPENNSGIGTPKLDTQRCPTQTRGKPCR